jgi:hypothetical protein
MKWNRTLQINDVVGLIGLHHAYPKLGVVQAIDGDVVAVHYTSGGKAFQNTCPTLWVPRAAVFDTRSWAGWIKFFWGMVR